MQNKESLINLLQTQKLLPLYYHDSPETSVGILRALYDAGIRMVEYTNRGVPALQNFRQLKSAAQSLPGLQLGIGTIKTEASAQAFIEAGADFIVCPTVNAGVAAAAQNAGLFWIPGCMTPTEIAFAEELGAAVVKIFPGSLLGPAYIQAIKELFPTLRFMPTGGVSADGQNLAGWFGAGVAAVGMGSHLMTKEWIQQKNYDAIKIQTTHVLKLIKEVSAAL